MRELMAMLGAALAGAALAATPADAEAFRGSELDCQPAEKTGKENFHDLNVTPEGLRTMRGLGIRTDLLSLLGRGGPHGYGRLSA